MRRYSSAGQLWVLLWLLSSCASYSSFQTAQTTELGELAVAGGIGYHEEGNEPYLNLSARYGLADSIDIGIGYNQTQNGSTLIMGDVKLRVKSNSPGFHHAVGFGLSPVLYQNEGLIFHAPYFASFHTPNEKISVYANPRVLYYIDMRQEAESNTGLGFATSFGMKLGRKFSVIPEWSFVAGQFEDAFEINNLISIGIGINLN